MSFSSDYWFICMGLKNPTKAGEIAFRSTFFVINLLILLGIIFLVVCYKVVLRVGRPLFMGALKVGSCEDIEYRGNAVVVINGLPDGLYFELFWMTLFAHKHL